MSLLIAFTAVIFSIYVGGWAVIISLWSVFISMIIGGFGGIFLGIFYLTQGHGALLLGCSILCLGLGILLYFGCKEITKLYCFFSKKITIWIKNIFIKKEK